MSPSSLCPAQPKLLAYRAMNTLDIFRVQDCALLGGERRVDRGLPARVGPVFLPRDVALVDIKSLNFGCGVIVDPQGDESLLRMLIAARWPVLTTGRVVNLDHQADVLSIDNDVVAVTKSALGHLELMGYRHPALIVSKSTASYVVDAVATAVKWGESASFQYLSSKCKKPLRAALSKLCSTCSDTTMEQTPSTRLRSLGRSGRFVRRGFLAWTSPRSWGSCVGWTDQRSGRLGLLSRGST
jgi:hypothetical protein